ncbi:MAG: hypothetical protein IJ420_12785 [Lachnospiraceae bacterium]|nr:hypothetical protein [Lachnospiraceae bacterium]MBQ9135474.1 hypothetical protein [Lachnospiraceae bacterium]
MAHNIHSWYFKDSIEREIKWAGKYGAKGEKRSKRKKATPEQIARQNQQNKEKKLRRLIKANFLPGDLWCTLKYPKGTRKTTEEYKKDIVAFITRCRREWKKRNTPFKFIYRLEIGKRGGVHLHMICNRLDPEKGKPDTDIILQEAWQQGRINYESLYDAGGFQALAEYIAKQTETGQLSLFDKSEQKAYRDYSCSRNLERPEPEIKEYKRRTVRSLVQEGPEPTPGYYIDKDSVRQGINPYNGLSYCHYIEYRIQNPQKGGQVKGDIHICREQS